MALDSHIRSIIIDDEIDCINSLAFDLEHHCPEVEVLEKCHSGKDGVKAINRLKPDLVFLDIDMPFVNGFDVVEMVSDIDFEIIFTTAYDKYAVQAFRTSAIDYLLKPIDPEELKVAISKVSAMRNKGVSRKQVKFFLGQLSNMEKGEIKQIALPTFDGIEFVNLEDINYCKSDGSYVYVYLIDGSSIFLSKTLHYLEEAICDYHFLRVHNSYIVNVHHIKKFFRADGGYLMMKNGDEVKVSRSKRNELLNLFSDK